MLSKSKLASKIKGYFEPVLYLIVGLALALGVSVLATTVGTNITVDGNLSVSGTAATSTFSTGGVNVGSGQFVVEQSSGNVGVGTTSPSTTFSVVGSGYLTAGLGVGIRNTTAGRIVANVDLGVATTSPAQALSVSGSGYLTGGLGVGIATTSAGGLQLSGAALLGGVLNVTGVTQLNGNVTIGDAAADTLTVTSNSITYSNAGTTTILSANANAWNIATSSAGIAFVKYDTTNYRVGIGTTSPGATLGVAGAVYSSGSITTTGGLGSGISTTTAGALEITGNALLGDAAGDLVMLNAATIVYNNAGTTTIPSTNASALNFATSSANIPLLRLDTSNTRVGIGTTSPGATFSVGGDAYVKGNLSVGTNGTNVATIQHSWINCGPLNGSYTLAASTTGFLLCNAGIPQGHATNDKIWLTGSSTPSVGIVPGWYYYTGKASSTAAGVIQAEIYNASGASLTNANLGTSSWQLLLIK